MKRFFFFSLTLAFLFLTACQPASSSCSWATGAPRYLTTPSESLPATLPGSALTPVPLEIGGKTIPVDKVVEGPLCNDT